MKPRQTARVLLFDSADRVLLIRCVATRSDGKPFEFWLTPGGEIEPGEEPLAAAHRELLEELGLDLEVRGPVYRERNQFEHWGEMRDNTDFVFLARCSDGTTPSLRGVTADEIAIMRELRWWSAAEISAALSTGQRIFPVDLADRMREFG
jgi:8-oxo-dGTP diphosphatase